MSAAKRNHTSSDPRFIDVSSQMVYLLVMASLVCEWKLENFSASAIYTGENRLVRVRGQGVCHQNGFELGLVRVNPGINPVRHRVHLGLVERPPEVGPQVETPVEIDEVFEIEPHITEVGIRGLGVLRVLEPA